jgi:hypothetical protein
MSRYKGRTKTKLVERDFPHHVDMMVPEFGFGAHLDAMYDWHHARGVLALHGSCRRDENGRYWIRWCFVDPKLAEAFAAEFAALQGRNKGCQQGLIASLADEFPEPGS